MNFKARMKSLLIVITLCWSANAMSNTAANVCGDLTFDRYSLDQVISYHGRQSRDGIKNPLDYGRGDVDPGIFAKLGNQGDIDIEIWANRPQSKPVVGSNDTSLPFTVNCKGGLSKLIDDRVKENVHAGFHRR